MDGQKQTYEQFKADILQWKDAHREEYRRFAKMMADGNEMQYLAVCRAIFKQLPGIRREWQQSWCDDSTDGFRNIGLHFKENAVPGQIVELYRKQREEDAAPLPTTFWGRMRYIFRQSLRKRCVTLSAPLVLSWLYYGKSFEAMVDMVSRQAGHPRAGNAERMGCSIVVRQIIEVSIKNGFRTQEDWNRHFAMKSAIEKGDIGEWALQSVCEEDAKEPLIEHSKKQTPADTTASTPEPSATGGRPKAKDLPLSSYIDCQNKDAVIRVLRKFLIGQHTANGLALSYYALTQLELLTVKSDKEFSVGVVKEFGDIPTLKSESSIRQAISQLRREQYITVNQKMRSGRLLDSDEFAPILQQLKNDIIISINNSNQPIIYE